MQSIVKTGKTVDEAVNEALKELSATLDEVNIEILEEPKVGFLGIIGSKAAVVRISLQEDRFKTLLKDSDKNDDKEKKNIGKEINKTDEAENDDSLKSSVEENEELKQVDNDSYDVEERVISDPLNTSEEVKQFCEKWITEILNEMSIKANVEIDVSKVNNVSVNIYDISSTDMGIIIGRRAETIDALQYLLSVTLNRHLEAYCRVFVNVGFYRERRKLSIEKLAKRNAEKVIRFHRPIALEPMNAYERRIVHTYLQNVDEVVTISEGREPYRKVVIRLKD